MKGSNITSNIFYNVVTDATLLCTLETWFISGTQL